jgi:hypothetical protein
VCLVAGAPNNAAAPLTPAVTRSSPRFTRRFQFRQLDRLQRGHCLPVGQVIQVAGRHGHAQAVAQTPRDGRAAWRGGQRGSGDYG